MKARFEFKNDEEYNEYIRTYFAAMAMQGWIACQHEGFCANGDDYAQIISERSLKCAEALINELNNKSQTDFNNNSMHESREFEL